MHATISTAQAQVSLTTLSYSQLTSNANCNIQPVVVSSGTRSGGSLTRGQSQLAPTPTSLQRDTTHLQFSVHQGIQQSKLPVRTITLRPLIHQHHSNNVITAAFNIVRAAKAVDCEGCPLFLADSPSAVDEVMILVEDESLDAASAVDDKPDDEGAVVMADIVMAGSVALAGITAGGVRIMPEMSGLSLMAVVVMTMNALVGLTATLNVAL